MDDQAAACAVDDSAVTHNHTTRCALHVIFHHKKTKTEQKQGDQPEDRFNVDKTATEGLQKTPQQQTYPHHQHLLPSKKLGKLHDT